MAYAMEKEGIKENTVHGRLKPLKFYYEQVLKSQNMDNRRIVTFRV
jgi:hypothetical protein